MRRREFLHQAGFSLGAAALLARPAAAQRGATTLLRFDPADWDSVRDQFPLSRDLIHMATFFLVSHPRPVADAIERHRQSLDANPVETMHEQRGQEDERQRAAAARYMGVAPEQIALTDSTTMGLGTLYGGLRLEPGEEILTTDHDHYSTHMSLQHRADRTGATVRRIALYDDPAKTSADEIVARLRDAITDSTRYVAVTWVHSSTGVKLPIAEMSRMLADVNRSRDDGDRVLLCVDGVHGFGVEDVTMDQLGCDFFVSGTHKWVFGPRGTGLIWGTAEAWRRAQPTIPSFGPNYAVWLGFVDPGSIPKAELMTPGGFHSFEHRWAMAEAFEFHMQIGKQRVAKRIHALNTMTRQALAEMSHIRLRTPMSTELSAGIICFDVDGMAPEEAVNRLRAQHIIASTTPYREQYARLAPCIINNADEVTRTIDAVRSLGR